jgi:hypothetical protein
VRHLGITVGVDRAVVVGVLVLRMLKRRRAVPTGNGLRLVLDAKGPSRRLTGGAGAFLLNYALVLTPPDP